MTTFSIVIPAYNQLSLLKRALDSVLQQERTDYEVIITDDSVSDDIQLYINSLKHPAVRYFRHSSNGTAIENWNYGLSMAEGRYIILMHHDEAMISKNYLSHLTEELKKAEIVISDIEVIIDGETKCRRRINLFKKTICQHPRLLFIKNVIGPTACLTFNRELLQPFMTELTWFVDVEWYYRMLKSKNISHCKECKIQSIHGHEDQISTKLDIVQAFRQDKATLIKLYGSNIRPMLWIYEHMILGTKRLLGRI